MKGVCQQRHFPAVAQPFKVFWAPWFLAVSGALISIFTTVFLMIMGFSTLASFALPIMLATMHIIAIVVGLKMRYVYTLLLSLENRKSGNTNLAENKGGLFFSNI